MKRMLLPMFEFSGHALEYSQHVINYVSNQNDITLICVFSEEFKSHIVNQEHNIEIYYYDYCELNKNGYETYFKRSYVRNQILKKNILKYNCDSVYLISYDWYYPLLPFMTLKNVKYVGVYYYIYFYDWKKGIYTRKVKKLIESALITCKMVKNNSIKCILFCNDSTSVSYANYFFNTNKFKMLPDPYMPIVVKNGNNEDFDVKTSKSVFIHTGVLGKRKGTIDILKAIEILPDCYKKRAVFVFAGMVQENIRTDFEQYIERLKYETNIIVYDKFCDYELLHTLYSKAACLLMPYRATSQSSGMFGYASQYNIPVIAPSTNLLGKLLRKYKMGYGVNPGDIEDISNAMKKIIDKEKTFNTSKYIIDHTPSAYVDSIISEI